MQSKVPEMLMRQNNSAQTMGKIITQDYMTTDKILQEVLVPAMDHQTDLIKLLTRPVLPNKLIGVLLLFRNYTRLLLKQ